LRALLNAEGRLPWGEAIRIVAAVASGLAAAHGQEPPIIHRDLKPENIMVVEGGAVKVMDFGIAKVMEALNQTNTQSVGTLQYMSPEQIDAHTIDHRSDLYCLGLVFYELLAGRPPFQSASPRQLLNLQCTAEPPPLPDEVRNGLPRGVEQLVFQLLEKAPEDRPYLAEDVVEKLDPFQTASGPVKSGGRSSLTSKPAITPHRAPSSGDVRPRATPAPSTPRVAEDVQEAPKVATPIKPVVERADTIALVDRVSKPREVSTAMAVGIVVALSVLAGVGAYVARSTGAPADTPAVGPTGGLPGTAPGTRQDRR
jgi:serine/threonine-protein kinase